MITKNIHDLISSNKDNLLADWIDSEYIYSPPINFNNKKLVFLMNNLWPSTKSTTGSLSTAFLYQLDSVVKINSSKMWFCKDGIASISWFLDQKLPTSEINSKIFLHHTLYSKIPIEWRHIIYPYTIRLKTAPPPQYMNYFITTLITNNYFDLANIDQHCEKIAQDLKSFNPKNIFLFAPVSSNSSSENAQIYPALTLKKIGDATQNKFTVINFNQFDSFSDHSCSYVYDLNDKISCSYTYFSHKILCDGGSGNIVDFQSNQKNKEIPLSLKHNLVILERSDHL